MTRSPLLLPGLALLAFLLSGLYVATHIGRAIDSDILSLLPGDAHDPVLADALRQASTVASNRVAFAIEGSTAQKRHAATLALSDALLATGYFQSSLNDGEDLWKWLFAHRTSMLCADDRQKLQAGQGSAIAEEAARSWYSPFGMGGGRLMQSDPFLLTTRLLGCIIPKSMRGASQENAEIISGHITASVYRIDVQDSVNAVIGSWRQKYGPDGLTLSRAGALFHATYGASEARSEMTIIGSITSIAVLIFYWLMFYSLRAPLIAVSMVVYCLTIGLALTICFFGHIHVMSLVFGAALIGMVVDYTTYYLVTGLEDEKRTVAERKAHIWKPLSLGMVTSVGAFAALLFFPVPAFQQIAILGGGGLIAAWAATLVLTPLLEQKPMQLGPGAVAIEKAAGGYLAHTPSPGLASAIILICLSFSAIGLMLTHTLDDVRKFQPPSAQLAAEEARISALTGFATSGSFMLVRGTGADETAASEERLMSRIEAAGHSANVAMSASQIAPSQSRMAVDSALIRDKLIAPHLAPFQAHMGLRAQSPYDMPPPSLPPPALAADLKGQTGDVYWSIVPLSGNATALSNLNNADWSYIEPATRYSNLMQRYRLLAVYGLIAAVMATGVLLVLAYRRLASLIIMLPMLLALMLTPVLTSLIGLPFSFFSAMGLFLVVGAGVDYAIFQWEHPQAAGKWTRVGIVLAALMTCISVGLLGLSSVLPVRSFGITVAIGILLSLLMSPLVRVWNTANGEARGQ